jgi:lipopolysaccharide transport system ATP-binding protein
MKDVACGGRTVLFVSHNMAAISQLCSRGIVIEDGKVALCETSTACISRYLAVDSDSIVAFKSKSFETLSFISARLENSRGLVTKNFHHDEPVCIEMQFNNKAAKRETELGMRVLSQEGLVVFTTQRSHALVAPVPSGISSVRVKIPAGFLTPGNYSITIAAHIPNMEILDLHESVLSFRIEETGSEFSRYSSTQLGIVFCKCEWADGPIYQSVT